MNTDSNPPPPVTRRGLIRISCSIATHGPITVLECEFSNQALGDGFRESKTWWNWALGPSSLFFLRCYRNPITCSIGSLVLSKDYHTPDRPQPAIGSRRLRGPSTWRVRLGMLTLIFNWPSP